MSTSQMPSPTAAGPVLVAAPVPAPRRGGVRSDRAADRFMRWALAIKTVDSRSSEGAHRTFRVSVVLSGLRCLISYVAIPVLVPILSLAGWVATPVGLALCVVAAVNGVISLRRFWRADHPHRWTYTAFIGVVFAILILSTITELGRLGVTP